jgi:hypothetical protein
VEAEQVKHLELIQGVISRLAGNSFALKGWAVTLVAGLFALAADKTNFGFVIIAIFPVLVFWGLDAYYLTKERVFRQLYDDVRMASANFSMNTDEATKNVDTWGKVLMSTTIAWFYLPLAALLAAVVIGHFAGRWW